MFHSAFNPVHRPEEPALWFVFHGNKLLVEIVENNPVLPFIQDPAPLGINIIRKQFIGYRDEKPCYSAEFNEKAGIEAPFTFISLRALYGRLPEELFWLAGRAFQIKEWDRTHQFCSACGTQTDTKSDERAKICRQCGMVFYPRLSPAVITAVIKDDEILLARNSRFPGSFYSVLAGFVEPGESLEECVSREIMEEAGITVKNITYFGSQTWPFPNSLMVGFTAEYDSGEIVIDEKEIEDARWFRAGDLPEIPPPGISIARKLIDWYLDRNRT